MTRIADVHMAAEIVTAELAADLKALYAEGRPPSDAKYAYEAPYGNETLKVTLAVEIVAKVAI